MRVELSRAGCPPFTTVEIIAINARTNYGDNCIIGVQLGEFGGDICVFNESGDMLYPSRIYTIGVK